MRRNNGLCCAQPILRGLPLGGMAATLALVGCASVSVGRSDDPGPYPTYYKEFVLNYLRNNLKDPDSLKDLSISPPQQASVWTGLLGQGSVHAWATCVTYNAKNSYGGYVGRQSYTYYFKNGAFVHDALNQPEIAVGC